MPLRVALRAAVAFATGHRQFWMAGLMLSVRYGIEGDVSASFIASRDVPQSAMPTARVDLVI